MSDGAVFSATALTVVLLVSGLAKARAPEIFHRALTTYPLIPSGVVPFLVVAVPGAEIVLALAQWVRPVREVAVGLICLMLAAFTILLTYSVVSGRDADCGCFGSPVRERVSWLSVLRNCVLIGLAVMGLAAGDGAGRGSLPAALAGGGAGLLVLILDQTQALFSGAAGRPRS